MSRSPETAKELVLTGIVSEFFETGMETVEWVFVEDGKTGYESIVPLEDGDFLEIQTRDGEILFADRINKNFDPANGERRPFSWIQTGVPVEHWLNFFLSEPSLPARIHLKAYRNLTMRSRFPEA